LISKLIPTQIKPVKIKIFSLIFFSLLYFSAQPKATLMKKELQCGTVGKNPNLGTPFLG
jgi:hypothetical protein